LLNDQSGSVLGNSTVFSWAGCHTTDGEKEAGFAVEPAAAPAATPGCAAVWGRRRLGFPTLTAALLYAAGWATRLTGQRWAERPRRPASGLGQAAAPAGWAATRERPLGQVTTRVLPSHELARRAALAKWAKRPAGSRSGRRAAS
jgi:hypothetical protein